MIPHIFTKENSPLRTVNNAFDTITHTVIYESNFSAQHGLQRLQDWLEGMFRISLSIRSSKMRKQNQRFWVMLEKFLDGWNCAYLRCLILEILLASATLPSFIGTLKSARITTLEAGFRCFERRLRVAFCMIKILF